MFRKGGLLVGGQLRDVVEMPHRERRSRFGLLANHLLNFGNDTIMVRQELADFACRFAGEFRDLLLREVEFVPEPCQGVGGFFGTEVGTLPVVDDLID